MENFVNQNMTTLVPNLFQLHILRISLRIRHNFYISHCIHITNCVIEIENEHTV